MWVTILLLVALVQLIQSVFSRLSARIDKRTNPIVKKLNWRKLP